MTFLTYSPRQSHLCVLVGLGRHIAGRLAGAGRVPFFLLSRLLPVGVAVTSDVHLGKATNIPHANNVDGEVAEKIDDLLGLVPKVEYEDDGSYNRGEKLV